MGITSSLAREFAGIGKLTERDKGMLRLLILDFFAASYAGYRQNRAFNDAVEAVVLPQGGAEEATVFGSGRRLPAGKAAFLNALYAHGAELDDGSKKAMSHVGTHVIPAVFALAETRPVSEERISLESQGSGAWAAWNRISRIWPIGKRFL